MASRELSVIIPTYNRRALVMEAIASALPLLDHAAAELVVVDDASRDGTDAALREAFASHVGAQTLRIVTHPTNLGVTAAKNAGAQHALGDWLVFLDSDDLLRREQIPALIDQLRAAGDAPIVFFRCVDAQGRLIGEATDGVRRLSIREIVRAWRWGECLPVVRRAAALRWPYDPDLKGVEAIAHNRMTRALGAAMLSPVAARTYRDDGADRLSTKAGIDARACELARGNLRILREFWRELGVVGAAGQVLRVALYALKCWEARTRRRGRTQPSLAQ